jgi:hypothetical protein
MRGALRRMTPEGFHAFGDVMRKHWDLGRGADQDASV